MTGNSLAADILTELGVLQAGETPAAEDTALVLGKLQLVIDSLAAERLTMTVVRPETFNLVSGTQTYTIGSGGVFNTARPLFLEGAAYLADPTATPPLETPIRVFSDQAWRAIPDKTRSGTYPEGVYFDHAWTAGMGAISVYPKPDSSTPDLVLYLAKALVGFADGSTVYTFAPGYAEMLLYNGAERCLSPFGIPKRDPQTAQFIRSKAIESLSRVKDANVRPIELSLDPALGGRRAMYRIEADA